MAASGRPSVEGGAARMVAVMLSEQTLPSVAVSTKTPGLIKWSTGGKNGAYGPITGADLPLKATLILDVPPHAATSQCGETNFALGNCALVSGGSTVKCQIK